MPETRLNRDVAVPLLSSAPPFPLSFPPDLPHRCRGHSGPASEPPWRILAARAQGVAARWEWHEHFHAVLPPPSRSRAKRREHPVIAVTTSFTVLAGPSRSWAVPAPAGPCWILVRGKSCRPTPSCPPPQGRGLGTCRRRSVAGVLRAKTDHDALRFRAAGHPGRTGPSPSRARMPCPLRACLASKGLSTSRTSLSLHCR